MSEMLLIRADASARMGTGHVMRCLALAQGWQRHGGKVLFLQAETTPALEQLLAREGVVLSRLEARPGTVADAEHTIAFARKHSAAWVVADGYHFDANYQRAIKAAGLRLLLFDDYGHADFYSADLVLNQNLGADPALYQRREAHTRLLLGTRYVLLREEFLDMQDWKREIPAVGNKVLVTMGGSDPDNVTGKVIQALKQFSEIETKVVIGGSNPHVQSLQSSIIHHPSSIQLVVDANNMPELMAWADVAIAAGGSTSWELAFMGLPSLVCTLADNQRAISAALELEGVSASLGQPDHGALLSLPQRLQAILSRREQRSRMSGLGRRLVDGGGSTRVVEFLITNVPSHTENRTVSVCHNHFLV